MIRRAPVVLLIGVLGSLPRTLPAQDALVLSGGGARGIAHGGVVVALERLGRDPDMVVGTSMGAVVGALYAAGYDPDEIWRIIVDQDWPALFTPNASVLGPDRVPRLPLLTLDGGEYPSGLAPDWRINRRLVQLLFDAQARSLGDFDRLPRRFRAIAANLTTGDRVVLGHGDLALAVRASMAVPGAFAPVRWGNDWLIDGGIRDNLPVGVARSLGADDIVAVDVLGPPPILDDVDPISIGLRGLRLLIRNADDEPASPDVLLLPPVPSSSPEFIFPRDPTPLLCIGYETTIEALGPPILAGPSRTPPPPPTALDSLVIVGGDPATHTLVRQAFRDVAPGPYDVDAVLRAMDRLYATGLFTGVWPSTLPAPPGPESAEASRAPRLRVQIETTEHTTLAGAAGYDNDRGGRAWAEFRRRSSLGTPTELGLAASGHRLERWAALSARRHSARFVPLVWSLGGYYREADVRRFFDDELLDEIEVRRSGGWIGADLRQLSPQMIASVVLRAENIAVENGDAGFAWGPLARLGGIESPTRIVGRSSRLEAETRFGAFDYIRAVATGTLEHTAGRLRLAVVAEAATTRGTAPPDALPALGDERRMPGLRWGEDRGEMLTVAGIDAAYPIPYEGFGRLRLRAGVVDEIITPTHDDARWLAGAELAALWSTPAGALLVAAGTTTDGRWRLDISVGPKF